MNISLDAGGLCLPENYRYGNYTFSFNLIQALGQYDNKNHYIAYSFDDIPSISNIQNKKIFPKKGWMKLRVTFEEMFFQKDIFLALNQSLPLFTLAQPIVFSHGLSFMFFKDGYKDYNRLEKQLSNYVDRGRWIVVSSQKVKDDIVTFYPHSEKKIKVIPFGVPFDMLDFTPQKRKRFFMFVGMNHNIKNVEFIVKMFTQFIKNSEHKDYELYLVGPFQDYKSKNIKVIPEATRTQLKNLYQTATGYLTASHYESFNFPVLEALSQECPVIGLQSSIIPEMQTHTFIAYSEKEFVDMMQCVAQGNYKTPDRKSLSEYFSWKKYVQRLKELYNK